MHCSTFPAPALPIMSRRTIRTRRPLQGQRHRKSWRRPNATQQQSKEFDRIELAAKLFAPPPIKFKDLETALDQFSSSHKLLTGPVFPFDVRTDYVRVTDSTDLVPITLQIKNRDITFVTKMAFPREK